MEGTPCEVVLNEGFRVYTTDVAALFPTDAALLEHRLAAYAGHPLHDLDGKPVGILAIASRQPLWGLQGLHGRSLTLSASTRTPTYQPGCS